MKLDRQSVIDAACLIVGSAIGASASVAFFFYTYLKTQTRGSDQSPGTGEPR